MNTNVAHFVWVAMIWRFWQWFGRKLRYVWHWPPKICWQAKMVAMTSPLHHAVERLFCMRQLLHFCQLLSNPSIDLELEYGISTKSQCNVDSNDVLSIRKYYQLYTYESNTFLLQNMPLKPLSQWGKRPQNSPLPLEARGPASNTRMPRWPHSPTQTTTRLLHTLPHNDATVSPLVTMRRHKNEWGGTSALFSAIKFTLNSRPKFIPKLPLPLRR